MGKRVKKGETPTALFVEPDTRCPQCGHEGNLENDFDAAGADPGNIFCNRCTTEFDFETGAVKVPRWEEYGPC